VEQNRRNERNIQERAATLKRLQSLSVLAGGVAHDLNNAIGPLIVLPDVILSEVEKAGVMDALPSFRDDIDTIKTSALRAAQTIKDLLTLGRQGRTKKILSTLASSSRRPCRPSCCGFSESRTPR
jgi:signal transduction histidine kinase